ncbi:hypothetical protein [Polyangium sp. y55x31]|uniref:Uma2 family endonuclease n=1 Tax=Polyangium sp. y55x31 TaxID=3042688 RepID=UPI0024829A36|nr:hypothetical protein [Polyangium sp. y55x31]MDI1480543.1 hypothetical protein [Polyangium sp. y55x31]
MGHPAEKLHPATHADLEAVPPHEVAELIQGTLYVFPRAAPRHASAHSSLGMQLGPPFRFGEGGPGGWWLLDEPELHLGVQHLWIVDRIERLLEVFALTPEGWLLRGVHHDDEKVRAAPFDAIELDLSMLWNKPAPPAGSST